MNHVIVYTTGVFDLIHPGHLNLLKKAKSLGDKLIVGVQDDDSVEKQKGKKPIMSCEQRMAMLDAFPFVDVVLSYSNVDQRDMLSLIKPDIMVQGGDWLNTGDRKIIIDFLNNNNIKLIQFPYTKGISSTEIKERVYNNLSIVKKENFSDLDFFNRIKLLPIEDIFVYESFDDLRVEKVLHNIDKSKVFLNPILVADVGLKGKYIVIDGSNRLEALKRLGAKYILVQVVDYFDINNVQLRGNEHYLDCNPEDFLNDLKRSGFDLIKYENIDFESLRGSNQFFVSIFVNGEKRFLLFPDNLVFKDKINRLNSFVQIYKEKYYFSRKSELGMSFLSCPIVIKFNPFSISDIIELSFNNLLLESGITWHIISGNIIHFKVPLDVLFETNIDRELFLRELISKRIKNSNIRRYLSNVYICDEWED